MKVNLITKNFVYVVTFLMAISCNQPKGNPQVTNNLPSSTLSPSATPENRMPSSMEWDKMAEQYAPKGGYKPEKGFVPDAQTAIKIAEAVFIPIYGEENIKNERPFRATLKNGIWIVTGTLPGETLGGSAVASIAKDTGRIIGVGHYK